jgi:hypothetical protein
MSSFATVDVLDASPVGNGAEHGVNAVADVPVELGRTASVIYPLAAQLALSMAALLAGNRSVLAIAGLGRAKLRRG